MQRNNTIDRLSHYWHQNINTVHILTNKLLTNDRLSLSNEQYALIKSLIGSKPNKENLSQAAYFTKSLKRHLTYLRKLALFYIKNGVQTTHFNSLYLQAEKLYQHCRQLLMITDNMTPKPGQTSNRPTIHELQKNDNLLLAQFTNEYKFHATHELLKTPFNISTQNLSDEFFEKLDVLIKNLNTQCKMAAKQDFFTTMEKTSFNKDPVIFLIFHQLSESILNLMFFHHNTFKAFKIDTSENLYSQLKEMGLVNQNIENQPEENLLMSQVSKLATHYSTKKCFEKLTNQEALFHADEAQVSFCDDNNSEKKEEETRQTLRNRSKSSPSISPRRLFSRVISPRGSHHQSGESKSKSSEALKPH